MVVWCSRQLWVRASGVSWGLGAGVILVVVGVRVWHWDLSSWSCWHAWRGVRVARFEYGDVMGVGYADAHGGAAYGFAAGGPADDGFDRGVEVGAKEYRHVPGVELVVVVLLHLCHVGWSAAAILRADFCRSGARGWAKGSFWCWL